jgi:hypothetical protein
MMREVKAKELSIVLIGKLSPTIITPYWLAGKNLISDLEAKTATEAQQYISLPDISQFKLSYCIVQVTSERYIISSTQEAYFEKLCEITVGIFTILNETPVHQIGINTIHHYDFGNLEEWHNFGHRLAPKEIWKTVTKDPGLKRLEMISKREDEWEGELNTIVGISEIFPLSGIRIQVNDHFNLYTNDELRAGKNINAAKSLNVLNDFNHSIENASRIINGIINHE